MSILSTLTSIFRSRTRSLLTMAGIAVGVFSVVLVSTVGTIGTQEVSSTLVTMGVDTLLVQAANKSVSVTLTDDDVSTVRRIDGVNDVMPLMASMTEAKMIGRRLDCYQCLRWCRRYRRSSQRTSGSWGRRWGSTSGSGSS